MVSKGEEKSAQICSSWVAFVCLKNFESKSRRKSANHDTVFRKSVDEVRLQSLKFSGLPLADYTPIEYHSLRTFESKVFSGRID